MAELPAGGVQVAAEVAAIAAGPVSLEDSAHPGMPAHGLPGPFACPERPGAPAGAAAVGMAASRT